MIKEIKILPPHIKQKFDKNLLSRPICMFDAQEINNIVVWIMDKITEHEMKNFPKTVKKLLEIKREFILIHERAKIEERNVKEKAFIKTKFFGYRPKFNNKIDENLLARLNTRRESSISNKRKDN